jgi:hypothetical protein
MAAVEVLRCGDYRPENGYGLQTTHSWTIGLDDGHWTEEDTRIRLSVIAQAWVELRTREPESTRLVRPNAIFFNNFHVLIRVYASTWLLLLLSCSAVVAEARRRTAVWIVNNSDR